MSQVFFLSPLKKKRKFHLERKESVMNVNFTTIYSVPGFLGEEGMKGWHEASGKEHPIGEDVYLMSAWPVFARANCAPHGDYL